MLPFFSQVDDRRIEKSNSEVFIQIIYSTLAKKREKSARYFAIFSDSVIISSAICFASCLELFLQF